MGKTKQTKIIMKKLLILLLILAACKKAAQIPHEKGDRVKVVYITSVIQKPAYVDTVLYRDPEVSEYQVSDTLGHTVAIWDINLQAY